MKGVSAHSQIESKPPRHFHEQVQVGLPVLNKSLPQGPGFIGFHRHADIRCEFTSQIRWGYLDVDAHRLTFAKAMQHVIAAKADGLPMRSLVAVLNRRDLTLKQ